MNTHPLQEAALSAGLENFFQTRVQMAQEFKLRMAAEDDICRKIQNNPEALRSNERKRQEIAENLWVLPVPVWQQMSGLYKGCQDVDSPNERAALLRKFMESVERLIRYELKHANSGGGDTPVPGRAASPAEETTCAQDRSHPDRSVGATCTSECDSGSQPGTSMKSIFTSGRRSVQWTPIPAICVYLEISQRHLSALCKEINGLAIEQLVDRIKAESLRTSFKERLKEFVLKWFTFRRERRRDAGGPSENARRDGDPSATTAQEIYTALKKSRREGFFHRATWALELGFSSYQRLFRASLLEERRTPHELELAIIESLIPNDAPCVHGQNRDDGERSRKDPETQRTEEVKGSLPVPNGASAG
ncbi:MAG TPA: hypothetical protein VEK08_19155 [Planctomycetota bacterium]|nr:hypothetical protein [Planctomycetota bacterium]